MLSRRELLRDFLKSRRARLKPQDIGLPQTASVRRTSGLRRSEVARRAGMSEEWYTFFETGRQRALTPHSAGAICEALSLSAAEREYVYDLALPAARPPQRMVTEAVPALERLFASAVDVILIEYDPWLTPIRRNPCASAIFSSLYEHGRARNALEEMLVLPQSKLMFGELWEKHVRFQLGLFRRNLARDPGNAEAARILSSLQHVTDFQRLWAAQDVHALGETEALDAEATLEHPRYGALRARRARLEIPGSAGSHVMLLSPIDEVGVATLRAASAGHVTKQVVIASQSRGFDPQRARLVVESASEAVVRAKAVRARLGRTGEDLSRK